MAEKIKIRTAPPLPFQGAKRCFARDFANVLNLFINRMGGGDGEGWTVIDAFGGSGLLARAAKDVCPRARVICNDREGYSQRLAMIDETEQIRAACRKIGEDVKLNWRDALPKAATERMRAAIERLGDRFGRVDYASINAWITFSKKPPSSDRLKRFEYFMLPKQPLRSANAKAWFDGLELESVDFEEAVKPFLADPKAVFVFDPPYVASDQSQYTTSGAAPFTHWDFFRLAHFARPPFVLFSSERSGVPAFIDQAIELKYAGWEKFAVFGPGGSVKRMPRIEKTSQQAGGKGYRDFMYFNFGGDGE